MNRLCNLLIQKLFVLLKGINHTATRLSPLAFRAGQTGLLFITCSKSMGSRKLTNSNYFNN